MNIITSALYKVSNCIAVSCGYMKQLSLQYNKEVNSIGIRAYIVMMQSNNTTPKYILQSLSLTDYTQEDTLLILWQIKSYLSSHTFCSSTNVPFKLCYKGKWLTHHNITFKVVCGIITNQGQQRRGVGTTIKHRGWISMCVAVIFHYSLWRDMLLFQRY